MQKKQTLHCNAEVVGANMKYRSSRRYNLMQKQQALNCNAKVPGATL
jgi:hypothetical protein